MDLFQYPIDVACFLDYGIARAVMQHTPRHIAGGVESCRSPIGQAVQFGAFEIFDLLEQRYGAGLFEEVGHSLRFA